jgi:hypothetical protein
MIHGGIGSSSPYLRCVHSHRGVKRLGRSSSRLASLGGTSALIKSISTVGNYGILASFSTR